MSVKKWLTCRLNIASPSPTPLLITHIAEILRQPIRREIFSINFVILQKVDTVTNLLFLGVNNGTRILVIQVVSLTMRYVLVIWVVSLTVRYVLVIRDVRFTVRYVLVIRVVSFTVMCVLVIRVVSFTVRCVLDIRAVSFTVRYVFVVWDVSFNVSLFYGM